MAEEEEVHDQDLDDVSKREEEKKASMSVSLSIWPPTQRTREAVIKRMVETLSTPSTLSKRYGSIPVEDASAAARLIEEEAFSAASNSSTSTKPAADAYEDDGIEILQIYSKEISKRMLEAVKARAPPPSPSDHSQTTPPAPTAGEDASAFESESSRS